MRRPVERRSSKARIGAGSFAGPIPKYRPPDEGWRLIEQTYGRELDERDRAEICSIVNSFLEWRCFEKAAPFVDNIGSKIIQLGKAARQLNRVLNGLLGRAGPDGDVAFHAERAIERAWPGAEVKNFKDLNNLSTLTNELAYACVRANKELRENGTPSEGEAWDNMIYKLAKFAACRGLSITVRKDTDKQADAKHSPFVVFVKAVQDQFPADVPIRFSTENSLAAQISRVLSRARQRGIDFSPEPEKQIPPED